MYVQGATKGAPLLLGFAPGHRKPFASLFGACFSVWKVGVWLEQCLPLGCQENSPVHIHRARASDGSTAPRLRLQQGRRAQDHSLGQPSQHTKAWPGVSWVEPRVRLLWPQLRKSWWSQFLPPGAYVLTMPPPCPPQPPGTRPGRRHCHSWGSNVQWSLTSWLCTHITDTLLLVSARAHPPVRGMSGALWGPLSCLHMSVLVCLGPVSAVTTSILHSSRLTP